MVGWADEAGVMDEGSHKSTYDWADIVMAYAGNRLRDPLRALLDFDYRLARIVRSTSEPALAQIKLAWWREEISRGRSDSEGMPPDPLLSSLLATWRGHKAGLIALIDGWEELVEKEPDGDAQARFRKARGAVFAAVANTVGEHRSQAAAARHGEIWAAADLAFFFGTGHDTASALPGLPKALRSLAIIGGLARRSLSQRRPMFGDRLSPLVAARLGIFGA